MSKPIAKKNIRLSHTYPFYITVAIWEKADFQAKFGLNTLANHLSGSYVQHSRLGTRLPTSRHIGTVNVIKGGWSYPILAHELMHAIIHKINVLGPDWSIIVDITGKDPQPFEGLCSQSQEDLCTEFENLFRDVMDFLIQHDPPLTPAELDNYLLTFNATS